MRITATGSTFGFGGRLLTATFLPLSACAGPKRIAFDYAPQTTGSHYASTRVTLFQVEDRRPYIVDHEKSPDWVGFWRWYGIPFNVTTESHRPFAEELSRALVRELTSLGFEVRSAQISAGADDLALAAALRAEGGRGLAVVIERWRANTNVNTALEYSFRVRVVDSEGRTLANTPIEDSVSLPGSWVDPPAAMSTQVSLFYHETVRNMVSQNPAVLRALVSVSGR